VGRGWGSFSFHAPYIHLIGFYISDVGCENSNAGDDSGRVVLWNGEAHHCSIRYCRFLTSTKHNEYQTTYPGGGAGNNDAGVRFETAHDVVLSDCYFEQQWDNYRNNQVHTLHYRAYYITVENNHFYRGTNAVFQKRGFWSGTPLKGIRCRFNLIERVSAGVHIAGVRNEGPDERDRNHYYCNVFLDCSAEIVRISTDNFTHLCHDDIQVYNNVIANNPGTSYGAIDIQPIAHGSLYNNEFSPADRNNKWFNNITVGTLACTGIWGMGRMEVIQLTWLGGRRSLSPAATCIRVYPRCGAAPRSLCCRLRGRICRQAAEKPAA
jgi:hypothetical protein